ncbi:MAG: response regulator [Myxococcota bacterium]
MPSLPAGPKSRPRLLIIDDDDLMRAALHRLLSLKYDVDSVGGGVQALERLQRDPSYALIVCDVLMPNMAGPDLLAHLEKRAPELARRMVFITALLPGDARGEFLARQPLGCLHKPFELDALFRWVEHALRSLREAWTPAAVATCP